MSTVTANGDPGPIDEARPQRAVQSVEVGGRLLLALAAHPAAMSLKDLAAAAALPASRAHPYLVSFCRLGLVEQDAITGRYALGPAALQVGLAALAQCDPIRAASPVAEELAARTGHAVAIAVWGNFGPTVVRMIEARQPLHVAMRAGTVMSLFGTATGRAFAAAMPRERLDAVLASPAAGAALHAGPVDAGREIGASIDEVRTHGVARAVGRPIPGVNAFSAPVLDHEGRPALVLTMLGHQDHFPAAWSSPLARAVRDAAAQVSARLGAAPAAH
ncbi:MAG: IclR family transcriptional regulator [Rubrivivax sp.]|nr:IclR family transcriptional regulator [Rubrivivax sp.]